MFLYVNRNDGTITRIDLSALPSTPPNCDGAGAPCTNVFTGGSRGDFATVGPDGCMYTTQSDRVIKLTRADGTCGFVPTMTFPQLVLTAQASSAAQGAPVSFTATFNNVSNGADVPITLVFHGPNALSHLGKTDGTGTATMNYTGSFTGTDDVYAVANFGNGSELTSNHVSVTWTPGKHTTLLSLNTSPETGAPNKSRTFSADLVDASVSPSAPVSGANVSFDLAGQSCNGTTDTNGHVSCTVTVGSAEGSYKLTAMFAGSDSLLASSQAKAFELVNPAPQQLLNISTRMEVLTGDNVLIGGFIVTGTESKKVLIRGLGPSLSGNGVTGTLQDTTLELHGPDGVTINDDWKDTQQAEIEATSIPPSDDRESAIVAILAPGNYTAILAGKGGTSGVGLVEVYDISATAAAKLANISTRGFIDTGDNVMIGGFIAGPQDGGLTKVLIRAIGPSLPVSNALPDPVLELHGGNGDILAANDDWKDSQQADIEATGIPPNDDHESALLQPLAPGNYTAIVHGKDSSTGIGLVEVYDLQ